jgi:hypothetical protein
MFYFKQNRSESPGYVCSSEQYPYIHLLEQLSSEIEQSRMAEGVPIIQWQKE